MYKWNYVMSGICFKTFWDEEGDIEGQRWNLLVNLNWPLLRLGNRDILSSFLGGSFLKIFIIFNHLFLPVSTCFSLSPIPLNHMICKHPLVMFLPLLHAYHCNLQVLFFPISVTSVRCCCALLCHLYQCIMLHYGCLTHI